MKRLFLGFFVIVTNMFIAEARPSWLLRIIPNASSTGAICIDGSSPGFYYQFSTAAEHKTDWIIFLEGGGLCNTESSCLYRASTDLGSSKFWPKSVSGTILDDGILSSKPELNPDF